MALLVSGVGFWFFGAAGLFARLEACGPFFPSSLLASGDRAVTTAPAVVFEDELRRMALEPPPGLVVPSGEKSERDSSLGGEIQDLRRALAREGVSTQELARVVLEFSRVRADLEDHRRELESRQVGGEESEGSEDSPGPRPTSREEAPGESTVGSGAGSLAVSGVPAEFTRYLEGAAAWIEGRTNEARVAWTSLLAMPASQRRFKTVWAAYMLGRSWHDTDPAQAERWYELTRRRAREGCADSAGLAVASLGWQGQLRLRQGDLAGALRHYADQYAAGGRWAASSLGVVARRVIEAPAAERGRLAGVPLFRQVVTAWVLSEAGTVEAWGRGDSPEPSGASEGVKDRWLATLEDTGISQVSLAEQMAVLAYQAGDWATADRWVALSGDSPAAAWVSAKLRVREGKLGEAARLLSGVVERFPVLPDSPERGDGSGGLQPGPSSRGPAPFLDSLRDPEDRLVARKQSLGELGAVRVARREFSGALDALLRAGYWLDAAYVAERVLELEELRRHVEARWPELRGKDAEEESKLENVAGTTRGQRERIRYLLGRRLMRAGRGVEAQAYLPAAWREAAARYLGRVREGADTSRAPRDRARSWMEAAWVARTNGLEILGTEVGPDWAIYDGAFEGSLGMDSDEGSDGSRHPRDATLLPVTAEERRRALDHAPRPPERFHYRYVAARLAWEAANLLPDQDPETARMLWTGGSWLKVRDPETADLFYKALVRRCRKTELGEAADRWRWFPPLDAEGRPRPKPAAPARAGPRDSGEGPTSLPEALEAAGTTLQEEHEPGPADPFPDEPPDPAPAP